MSTLIQMFVALAVLVALFYLAVRCVTKRAPERRLFLMPAILLVAGGCWIFVYECRITGCCYEDCSIRPDIAIAWPMWLLLMILSAVALARDIRQSLIQKIV